MKQKSMPIAAMLAAALFLTAGCGESKPDGGGRDVLMWIFTRGNLIEWFDMENDIEEKFNINLVFEIVPQNGYIQKLRAVIHEERGVPDILEWMIENNRMIATDPEKSMLSPLDDYVKNSALFQKVPAGRRSWLTYGGHIYGLPHDVHPVVLVYNDTLWKEAGVDIAAIRDWDEFMAAGQKLIRKKQGGKPLHYALPYGDDGLGDSMWMIWQQTGTQLFDESEKPLFTSDGFKAFTAKWLEWRKTGVFTNWDWGNFSFQLKDGTLCSYVTPDWWVSQVNAAAEEGKYEWRVRDLPLFPNGNGSHASSWGGSFLAIPKTAKDKDFIFKVIEYMQYGNPEVAVARYETGGMLSPVPDAWDDPVFHQPDPRFGGQKLGELHVSLAPESPVVKVTDVFWDAVGYFNEEYTEITAGNVTLDEGLQRAQEKTLQKMME